MIRIAGAPMGSLFDRLREEFERVLEVTKKEQATIEPTPEEARNGWTAAALTEYVAERNAAQAIAFDPTSAARRFGNRPRRQKTADPLAKWKSA